MYLNLIKIFSEDALLHLEMFAADNPLELQKVRKILCFFKTNSQEVLIRYNGGLVTCYMYYCAYFRTVFKRVLT